MSFLFALVMLIPPIGWAGLLLGFPLWTILVAVLLWMAAGGRRLEPAADRKPLSACRSTFTARDRLIGARRPSRTSPRQAPVSTPRALDELLEALEVDVDGSVGDADLVGCRLGEALRAPRSW